MTVRSGDRVKLVRRETAVWSIGEEVEWCFGQKMMALKSSD